MGQRSNLWSNLWNGDHVRSTEFIYTRCYPTFSNPQANIYFTTSSAPRIRFTLVPISIGDKPLSRFQCGLNETSTCIRWINALFISCDFKHLRLCTPPILRHVIICTSFVAQDRPFLTDAYLQLSLKLPLYLRTTCQLSCNASIMLHA